MTDTSCSGATPPRTTPTCKGSEDTVEPVRPVNRTAILCERSIRRGKSERSLLGLSGLPSRTKVPEENARMSTPMAVAPASSKHHSFCEIVLPPATFSPIPSGRSASRQLSRTDEEIAPTAVESSIPVGTGTPIRNPSPGSHSPIHPRSHAQSSLHQTRRHPPASLPSSLVLGTARLRLRGGYRMRSKQPLLVRLAILSDIHSNLEALERTFQAVDDADVDAVYCLGDVVGYNADPAACVDLVRERCDAVVLGNHDAAVAREIDVHVLPADGQEAARHNRAQLSDAQRPAAQDQFDHFGTDVCFIGHTHSPAVMADTLGIFRVRAGHRYLINVGSVGQPRDGTPKLSFGLFDTDTYDYENVRLDYDVAAAARKIRNADRLPDRLADRLEEGR
ncbi:MAG: hypothetical protein BRD53_00830 [Bacteroidetes bacterium SW_7_64_58]|nr:MAG: hypothetical protein BRD53_00830 [Bacteroidetes bacterium SW_7_64_58]